MNLNVNIAGTHGGITVGADGATHQALEEITLMRALPNMTVIAPCDANEAERATVAAAKWKGPVYLRLGRAPVPNFTDEKSPFKIGKANLMRDGGDLTVITFGHMVYESMKAADILDKKGISLRVINLHTIKPIDKEMIMKAANETGAIITAEEHTTIGGLGSAVCEALAVGCPVPVEIIGVKDRFGISGKPLDLMKEFELTADDIVKAADRLLIRKRSCEAR